MRRGRRTDTQAEDGPPRGILHARRLANLGHDRAERACAEAIVRHPRPRNCITSGGPVAGSWGRGRSSTGRPAGDLNLDRSLARAFSAGSIPVAAGDLAGARRAYRNARDLCAARTAEKSCRCRKENPAGRADRAASAQLAILDSKPGDSPHDDPDKPPATGSTGRRSLHPWNACAALLAPPSCAPAVSTGSKSTRVSLRRRRRPRKPCVCRPNAAAR